MGLEERRGEASLTLLGSLEDDLWEGNGDDTACISVSAAVGQGLLKGLPAELMGAVVAFAKEAREASAGVILDGEREPLGCWGSDGSKAACNTKIEDISEMQTKK